jgi:hypothetical protein
MSENRFKLHYRGSIGWLIFWFIIFFPLAFVLLLTASTFEVNQTTYNMQYDGSRFWLCFWFVIFFPVAIVLLFVNGFSVTIDKPQKGEDITLTNSSEDRH